VVEIPGKLTKIWTKTTFREMVTQKRTEKEQENRLCLDANGAKVESVCRCKVAEPQVPRLHLDTDTAECEHFPSFGLNALCTCKSLCLSLFLQCFFLLIPSSLNQAIYSGFSAEFWVLKLGFRSKITNSALSASLVDRLGSANGGIPSTAVCTFLICSWTEL